MWFAEEQVRHTREASPAWLCECENHWEKQKGSYLVLIRARGEEKGDMEKVESLVPVS